MRAGSRGFDRCQLSWMPTPPEHERANPPSRRTSPVSSPRYHSSHHARPGSLGDVHRPRRSCRRLVGRGGGRSRLLARHHPPNGTDHRKRGRGARRDGDVPRPAHPATHWPSSSPIRRGDRPPHRRALPRSVRPSAQPAATRRRTVLRRARTDGGCGRPHAGGGRRAGPLRADGRLHGGASCGPDGVAPGRRGPRVSADCAVNVSGRVGAPARASNGL